MPNIRNHEPPIIPKQRFPRPQGLTHKALTEDPETFALSITTEYLRGTFPNANSSLTIPQFQSLYKIPSRIISKATRNLMTISPSELQSKGVGVITKMLEIVAQPHAKIEKLTRFLESNIYSPGAKPSHLLIQQLVGSLGLEQKSAIDITKLIGNLATSEIIEAVVAEELLSHTEAIKLLSEDSAKDLDRTNKQGHIDSGIKNTADMEAQLEAEGLDPNLVVSDPSSTLKKRRKIPNTVHEPSKLKSASRTAINQPPTTLPV